MIESLLERLAGLPPSAVYLVLALLAAAENVFPPVPSDVAVALGAFLTHRGVTTLPTVFAVTWTANLVGAVVVYVAARRYGRGFFATRAGQALLSPRAIAVIEREYLRFGVAGIFVARLLPGLRAVVAPFAGLAGLGWARSIVPMAVASALWYAVVCLIGATIGAEWSGIERVLSGVNRTLGILALIVAAVIAFVAWRRRRSARRERVWAALEAAVGAGSEEEPTDAGETAMRRAAVLILELAYADPALTDAERDAVVARLRGRWELVPAPPGAAGAGGPARFREYGRRITQRFARDRRLALVERLWRLVLSGDAPAAAPEWLIRHAADLLELSPDEVAAVRRQVAERAGPGS